MQNTPTDLMNHCFAELERLGDESLTGEALHQEIDRAKAISLIGSTIVNTGNMVIKAAQFADAQQTDGKLLPNNMLGDSQ